MSTAIVRRPGDQVSPATSPVFNTSKLPTDIPGSRLSASRAGSMTSMDDEPPAGASLSAPSSSSRPTKRKTPPTPESQPKIKLRFAGTRDTSPTPSSAATHSKAEGAQLASHTRSRSPIKTPLTSFPDPPSGVLKRKEVSPNKDATTSGPPKRAPRKKRKWLKKGEVDPDDPVAVARQKERFGIIDQALAELNRQEALVRNGTQWQLQVLEKELDRRRDLQLARLQNSQTAAEEELEYATEHDDHFIRETWRDQAGAIINDVFDKMEADAYRLDREYNFLKKVPGAAPRLRDDYGKGSWGVHVDRLHSTKTVPLVRVQVPGDDRVRYRRDIDITPDYLEPRARAHDCNAFGLRAPRALATWDREDNHPVTGPGIYPPAGNKAWPTWYNARTEPEEWEYILGSERYATLNAEHKQRQERGLKQMAADKKREEDREREKRARASRDPRKEQEVYDAFARLAEAMEQEIKNDEKKRKEEWNKEQEQEWEKYLQRMDHLDKMKEREAAAKAAAASTPRHVASSSAGQPSADKPRMDAAITAPKRAASPVPAPHQSLRQVATPAASSSQPRQTAAHRPASPPRAAVTAAPRGAPTGSTSAEARVPQTAPVRVSTDTPKQNPAPTSIANLISRSVSTGVEAKPKPASSASASAAAQASAAPSQSATSRSGPGVPERKEPASQAIMDRASSIVHNIKPHGTFTPATTPAPPSVPQSRSVSSTAAPQKASVQPPQPAASKSTGAMAPTPDRAAAARTTSGTSLQTPQPSSAQATPKSTTPSVQHPSAAKPTSSKLPVAPAQTPTTSSSAAKEPAASASDQLAKTPAHAPAQEAPKLSNGSTPSVLEPPRPTATPAVEPTDPWKVIRPAAAFKAPSDNFLGRFASTKPASVFGTSSGVPQSTFGSSRPYSQQSPSISGTLSFGASASPWGKPATPATPSTPATPLTGGLERKTSSGSFGAFAASSPFARTATGAPLVLETQLRAWSGETLPPGVTRRRGPADVLLEDEDVTEVDPPPADFDENRPLRERSIRPVAGIPESPHPAVPTIQYNSHEDRYLWRANREWGLTYERRDAIHECHKRWKAAMANKQDILDESAKREAVIKEQAEIKERLEKLRAKELEEEAERRREERRLNEEIRAENRIRLEKEAQDWLRRDKEKQEEKRRYNERMEEERRERERAAEQLKREKADKRNAQARERRRAKKLEDEARREKEKEARADAAGAGVGTSAGMAPVSKSATAASAATNGSTPRSASSKQSTPAPTTDKTSASASGAARAPASASTGGSAQPKGI